MKYHLFITFGFFMVCMSLLKACAVGRPDNNAANEVVDCSIVVDTDAGMCETVREEE